ncbi:hypothetical protein [Labedella endophytica]|uniref:Uncharacterized protein n=1 Tax=Labedella endophytica TaxID=1523160 RepID=A0A433JVR0_9MICO|nr:hypothetical protein [Labedella endophytica]RUR03063.1 hypothetical protein ELQ94_00430 [Labedella endophytica]
MIARIENHWWREGWRLVRERLPGVVTPRRRLVLAAVVALSIVIGTIGGLLLFSLVDEPQEVPGWPGGLALGLFAAQLAMTICAAVWERRDRQPEYRSGRVSLGIEPLLDIRQPLPETSSSELLDEAHTHVERTRRAVPALMLVSISAPIVLPAVIVLLLVAGWWSTSSLFLIALFLLNMGQPLIWLKTLGSTTAQLARLDRIPVAPTTAYRGPKAWGIEAPRKAVGDEPSPG